MKQPTAPTMYPNLPLEDGQNYRLQKISEIEQKLTAERQTRKSLYKKYKRAINFTDGIDTVLISASVIMGGLGMVIPLLLPLEVAAVVCGVTGVCVKFIRRKLHTKTQKHDQIRTIAESKLNSVKALISKALKDGQISDSEFQVVLGELEKYYELKNVMHPKNSKCISDQERNKLIQEGKTMALSAIQRNITNM